MPKMFEVKEINIVQSQKILDLIYKANALTDTNGYETYDDNEKALENLLEKILLLAKQEQEWPIYFIAFKELFYLLWRNAEYKKVLKYAEVFYHDFEKYIDIVAETSSINIGTESYRYIYAIYSDFTQISEEKLHQFMKSYEQNGLKYGGVMYFYEYKLLMALKYRDKELAVEAKREYEKYDIKSCYLCAMLPILGYYILFEDYESLEYKIEEIRTRSIPSRHKWCYTHCYLADDKELVSEVLSFCIKEGKSDYFHKFFEKNKELYQCQYQNEQKVWDTNIALYHAYAGDWVCMDEHIKSAECDVTEWKKMERSAWDYMCYSLSWYCYFTLLNRHGIPSVKTELAGSEVPETEKGECSSLSLAEFFEAEADKVGAEFDKAREKFDYAALKRSYKECINI